MLKHLFFLLLTLCSLTSYAHADKALIDVLNASQYDIVYLKTRPDIANPATLESNRLRKILAHVLSSKYNKIVLTLSDESDLLFDRRFYHLSRAKGTLDFSLKNGDLKSLIAAPSITKIKHVMQCDLQEAASQGLDCSKLSGTFNLFLKVLSKDSNVAMDVKIATLKGGSYQRTERVDSVTGEKGIFFVYETKIQKKFDSLADFLVTFFKAKN